MQQEIRLATFNVRNLVLPDTAYYDDLPAYTQDEYEAKTEWIAKKIDQSDADVIGFQEIFSKRTLEHVIAKTQRYRDAELICFDQNISPVTLRPQVALLTRLPMAGSAQSHQIFPRQFEITLPITETVINHFSRPVLEAPVLLPNGQILNIYVVHLKSKRPDFLNFVNKSDPYQYGLAALRSLMRRSADALGVRALVSEFRANNALPIAILGDFNDFSLAVTTTIVSGQEHESEQPLSPFYKLYDCYEIQTDPALNQDKILRFMEENGTARIDHIFVSEEFTEETGYITGAVKRMSYLPNEGGPELIEMSDHTLALATIRLS